MKKCLDLVKAFDEDMTDAQAMEILASAERVVDYVRQAQASMKVSDDDLIFSKIDDFMETTKTATMIERRNLLKNIRIKQAYQFDFKPNFRNAYEALDAFLGGTLKNREGGKRSVDAQMSWYQDSTMARFLNALEDEGLDGIFASGIFDSDITMELWAVNTDPGMASPTKNKEARMIAELISALQTELVDRLNGAGAFIRTLPGYIVRQSHDPLKISAVTEDEFVHFIAPLLDNEKTFGIITGAKEQELYLREAYRRLITGNHDATLGGSITDDVTALIGFKGPSNLGKRVSQHRKLHFKDAAAWMKYNERFGHGNLREALLAGIRNMTKNIVLMETLGPNPQAMFDTLMQEAHNEMTMTDPHNFSREKERQLRAMMRNLDGSTQVAHKSTIYTVSQGLLAMNNWSKLGSATVSSFGDIVTAANNLFNNGVNPLAAYGKMFRGFLEGRGKTDSDRRRIAGYVGIGLSAQNNAVLSRLSNGDTVPGLISKFNQKLFKWNGMNLFNDTNQSSVAAILAANLGEHRTLAMKDLPDELQRAFKQYGIMDSEWDALRKRALKGKDFDEYYIAPDLVDDMTDAEIIDLYRIPSLDLRQSSLRRAVREGRNTLESKFGVYLRDQISFSVIEPGVKERAWLNQGLQAGTPLREAINLLTQFKQFPLTVVRKGLLAGAYGRGAETLTEALLTGRGSIIGLAAYVAQTTLMGYLSMVALDFFRGKTPADPTRLKVVMESMLRGGGLGIFGDFMFGEYNKYGNSVLATMGGPAVGQFETFMKTMSGMTDYVNGDKTVGKREMGRVLKAVAQSVPGQNLFYTRKAFEYLVLDRFNEMANPGYMNRVEKMMRQERGQEYWAPNPKQFTRYGG